MKSILLDVDEVITFSGFLPAVNEFLGTNYEIDDIEDFYIDRTLIPPERVEEWQKFMAGRNLWLDEISMRIQIYCQMRLK